MYKYVFIDLDDTLWDFHANAKSTLHEIFLKRNFDRYFDNFEHYFEIYSKRNLELWDLYGKGLVTRDELSQERFFHPLKQVGINNTELASEVGKEYLELLPSRTELVPFARELLDYLFAKYQLTIVSNGFIEVQYNKLKTCNLEQFFSHVVLSEAAGALKPDKQIFEYALQLNNATAAETIMIGDSFEADIRGAQNAGIDQIFFNLNNEVSEKFNSATYQIHRLEEILEII